MKSLALTIALACLGLAWPAVAGDNLVPNGGFDNEKKPLSGWYTEYTRKGESWYKDNHTLVSVVADDERPHVLKLDVATQFLADNPGVKAESHPIPFDPKKRYRFSAAARSTGPCARIMLEGYTWKPGVKPHEKPERWELRSTYRFPILMFKPAEDKGSSEINEVPRLWTSASAEFPSPKLTDLAKSFYAKSEFVMVRLVGIAGKKGELFVDDVTLEELPEEKPKTEEKADPKTPQEEKADPKTTATEIHRQTSMP